MRISCILNETIEKDNHLVALELVINHDIKQLIGSILKEKYFSLERICVEQFVSNLGECFYHKIENVLAVSTD